MLTVPEAKACTELLIFESIPFSEIIITCFNCKALLKFFLLRMSKNNQIIFCFFASLPHSWPCQLLHHYISQQFPGPVWTSQEQSVTVSMWNCFCLFTALMTDQVCKCSCYKCFLRKISTTVSIFTWLCSHSADFFSFPSSSLCCRSPVTNGSSLFPESHPWPASSPLCEPLRWSASARPCR